MMANEYNTLIDRLNEIVDEVHIDEVKQIITTLSKINDFKHSIEDDLCADTLYQKIKILLVITMYLVVRFQITPLCQLLLKKKVYLPIKKSL